jgi:DedD protein
MGLFSFLNKNKQETTTDDSGHYSRAEDDAVAAQARSKRASSAGEGAARRGKAKAAADPVLPEKKRARRRLVGAIALALGVAIGLPMVLDSEPKPLASDIDIRIPSKDKGAPAVSAAPAATPPVAPAASLSPHETIVPAAATPHDIAEVRTGSGKQPEVKIADKPAVKVPELKVAAKPADKPAEKPADKPAVKPAAAPDAARALAILEGKPAEPANQKFVVQVTALASQAKVDEVREKLTEAGIKSYTQKVPTKTGELIRVRVGPLSREEAEKVRAKLSAIGMSGSMVPG